MIKRVFLTSLLFLMGVAGSGCIVAPYPAEVAVVGPPVIYGAPGVVLEVGSPVYVVEYNRAYGCCFHTHYYRDGGHWRRGRH